MNADGSGQTRITGPNDVGTNEILRPAWSPSGKIAFESNRDGDLDIYVMNVDGTSQTLVTVDPLNDSHTTNDYHSSWSPDGASIAFESTRGGNVDIYAISADGTGLTRVTTNAADDRSPAWSPFLLPAGAATPTPTASPTPAPTPATTSTATPTATPTPTPVAAPPAAPSNLVATVVSATQVNLTWTDNSNDETGFRVERCPGAACTNFATVSTVAANVTAYADAAVSAGNSYVYRVVASNAVGASSPSNTAVATLPALPPTVTPTPAATPTPTPTPLPTFLLTTAVTPSGSGTVQASPPSDNGRYTTGTSVSVTASCPLGFVSWSGDLPSGATATDNPLTVVMDKDRSLTAQCKLTTVKVASANLLPGANATLEITVENISGAGLAGYDVTVVYNAAVLRVNSVLGGDGPFSNTPLFAPSPPAGSVNIASAAVQGPTTGSIVVARLSVTALGSPGSWSSLDISVNELLDNSTPSPQEIAPRQAQDGLVTIGSAPSVAQSIFQGLENVVEGGSAKKKVWVTLRADGALLSGQPHTLQGGLRHVDAVLTYSPSCMTVLAAKGTAPFATTSSAIDAVNGKVSLVVDVPEGVAAAETPAEFGRLLVRLTGSHTSPCLLTLTSDTRYGPGSGDGFPEWSPAAATSRQYVRGDARGIGVDKVTSVTQAIAMLRFIVSPDSNAALSAINALNAASVHPNGPTQQGQPDNGDHISTADAILLLRRIVRIVDSFFLPCGQQVCS